MNDKLIKVVGGGCRRNEPGWDRRELAWPLKSLVGRKSRFISAHFIPAAIHIKSLTINVVAGVAGFQSISHLSPLAFRLGCGTNRAEAAVNSRGYLAFFNQSRSK